MHQGAYCGTVAVLQLLTDAGGDVNGKRTGWSLLVWMVFNNDFDSHGCWY